MVGEGTGLAERARNAEGGEMKEEDVVNCPGCGGDGIVQDEDGDDWPCPMCGGSGDENDVNEEEYPRMDERNVE